MSAIDSTIVAENCSHNKRLVVAQAAGATAVRLEVYQTGPASDAEACQPERQLLLDGNVHAIAFTSTAEVGLCLIAFVCSAMSYATQCCT